MISDICLCAECHTGACRIFSSLDSDEECTSNDAMHLNERPPASGNLPRSKACRRYC